MKLFWTIIHLLSFAVLCGLFFHYVTPENALMLLALLALWFLAGLEIIEQVVK